LDKRFAGWNVVGAVFQFLLFPKWEGKEEEEEEGAGGALHQLLQ
jgi:hypothetical protein